MTNEDKEDCLVVLNEIKDMCAKFNCTVPEIKSFIYNVNEATDVLIEIIEGPKGGIEKMF